MRRLIVLLAAVGLIAGVAPAAAQAPNVTLTIGKALGGPQGSVTTVTYGQLVELSGEVTSGQAGENVLVTISPYRGEATTRSVITQAGGEFTVTDKPAVRTSYTARWRGQTSAQEPFTYVRPAVSLSVRNARLGRFSVRLAAQASSVSHIVWFQRRVSRTRWATVKRVRVGVNLGATFRARLPRGLQRVRAVVPPTPGYLAGTSRFVLVRGTGR